MKSALIIVDVQNDFCEKGSLEVPKANEVLPVVNKIRESFDCHFKCTILTQDWHPKDHISFKDSPWIDKLVLPDELTDKWKVKINITKRAPLTPIV